MEKGTTIKVHEHGFVRYIDHMGTDTDIVEAARISYKSPSKGPEADAKLLRYLFRNKHVSPFEMVKIKLNIKLPIFVMRQYVRHRMQNLNEVSARYTELPNEFFLPDRMRAQDAANKQGSVATDEIDHEACRAKMNTAFKFCYNTYTKLLEAGVAREMARIVLPVGIYTEVYVCWDMNNLLKFFALRDDAHAQAEIQDYARAMKVIAAELFPVTMHVYEEALGDRYRQAGRLLGLFEEKLTQAGAATINAEEIMAALRLP